MSDALARVDSITTRTKFSYGLGALGKDFACSIVYLFLMYYYTDVAGVPAAFVGTLFLVVRMIDAVSDPIMGMIVDNTRSRFGKFRPWIVLGTVINSLALLALFSAHLFSGFQLLLFVTVTYIIWGLTYTIMDIPFWSMVPALSAHREERERLVVWPRLFASVAWTVVGTYGLASIAFLGEGDEGRGFLLLSGLIIVAFLASALVTFTQVQERIATRGSSDRFSFGDVITILRNNDQLASLIGCVLTFNIGTQLVGGFAIYYFSYAIGKPELFPMFALVSGIAEMFGIFIFPWLCRYLPRRLTWYIASLFALACSVALLAGSIVAPESGVLVAVAGALLKFGGGIANGLGTVMLADVVDYGHYKTGKRSESIIFSVQTMLVKFAGAFAGFFIGVGLSLIGYVPNEVQNEATVLGLRALMIGLPVVFLLASIWVYHRTFRLHGALHQQVSDFLSRQ
ncbi:MAG: melibiose:sodium transporter MelB [Gammaproteobacteria bacterium]|nr:melibiose:sodium transporter MelB [Gammaproteobacteria bacterium]